MSGLSNTDMIVKPGTEGEAPLGLKPPGTRAIVGMREKGLTAGLFVGNLLN
jgi:hypothetical protein